MLPSPDLRPPRVAAQVDAAGVGQLAQQRAGAAPVNHLPLGRAQESVQGDRKRISESPYPEGLAPNRHNSCVKNHAQGACCLEPPCSALHLAHGTAHPKALTHQQRHTQAVAHGLQCLLPHAVPQNLRRDNTCRDSRG